MGALLNKAIIFATQVHDGQLRKGSNSPYILHPLEAAAIVSTITLDEEIIAAAVLHDVVEDTPATLAQVESMFGKRVAFLVAGESENKREDLPAADTWKIRKIETIDHLKNADEDIKIITLGDKLSNIRAINRDYKKLGDDLWQRFNQKNKSEHEWYYRSIAECLSDLKDHQAYAEYVNLVDETFA